MPSRARLLAVVTLALVGALLSLVLLFQHHGESIGLHAVEATCGAGGGCEQVNASSYSSIAGVPLAGIGLVFYASLAALLILAAIAGASNASAARLTTYVVRQSLQ